MILTQINKTSEWSDLLVQSESFLYATIVNKLLGVILKRRNERPVLYFFYLFQRI